MAERVKSEHKNASRSRFLIKRAYGELLNEKDPKKITVTDIVERADISRGTFYAHYLDVYDLNMAIQNNMLSTLDTAINNIGIENLIIDPTEAVTAGLKFLEENKSYIGLFVSSSQGNALIARIVAYMEDRLYSVVDKRFSSQENERIKLFVTYTLGAYKAVVNSWFAGGFKYSAEECTQKLVQIYMTSRPQEVIDFEKNS